MNFEYGKLEFIAKFPKLGSDLKCNVYYFIWILCIHTEQQDGFYDQVTYQDLLEEADCAFPFQSARQCDLCLTQPLSA